MGAPQKAWKTGDGSGGENFDNQHGTGDWAPHHRKYECPKGYYLSGISGSWNVYGDFSPSQSFCVMGSEPAKLSNSCNTVWFQDGNNRPANAGGGDFASGSYKGQCKATEYIAGVAQYFTLAYKGYYSAVLCCSISQ